MAIFAPVPNEQRQGDPMRADWASGVVQNLRQLRGIPDGGGFQSSGGLAKLTRRSEQMSLAGRLESLWAYASGDSVKVTSGNIQHVYNGVVVTVADAELTPEDSNKIWIERTDANAWSASSGANYPTDSLYIPLVDKVTIDSSGASIDDADRCWFGGDIVLPEILPVTVAQDGGSEGNTTTTCDFTYTATTLGNVQIDTTMDNKSARIPNVGYTAGTVGFVVILADGTFELYVADETPKTSQYCLAVVTAVDSTTGCITAEAHQFTMFDNTDAPTCP